MIQFIFLEGTWISSHYQAFVHRHLYYLVGSQVDNLFHLDAHHIPTTIALRPPTQTTERERGIPMHKPCLRTLCHPQPLWFPDVAHDSIPRTHRHSHTRQPHHCIYQSSYPRACLFGFCERRRRIGSTFDAGEDASESGQSSAGECGPIGLVTPRAAGPTAIPHSATTVVEFYLARSRRIQLTSMTKSG